MVAGSRTLHDPSPADPGLAGALSCFLPLGGCARPRGILDNRRNLAGSLELAACLAIKCFPLRIDCQKQSAHWTGCSRKQHLALQGIRLGQHAFEAKLTQQLLRRTLSTPGPALIASVADVASRNESLNAAGIDKAPFPTQTIDLGSLHTKGGSRHQACHHRKDLIWACPQFNVVSL